MLLSVLLDICLKVDLLDHVTFLFLIFLGTDILFSLVAVPFILTNNAHRFQFLSILDNASNFLFFICFVCFLVVGMLMDVRFFLTIFNIE